MSLAGNFGKLVRALPGRRRFYCVVLLILALLPTGLSFAAGEDTTQLTLGVLSFRPKADLESRWAPLMSYLNERLPQGVSIHLKVLDEDEMSLALRQGELDYVYTNPTHFTMLRTLNPLSGALVTPMTLVDGLPMTDLGGVIIRRADSSGPLDLADLRHKRVATAGEQFLGGFVAPAMELKQAGIDTGDLDLVITGPPHDRVVEAVLDGRADAGFIRTGVLEQMFAEGRLSPEQIAIIHPVQHKGFPLLVSTRLYPEWVFVAVGSAPNKISQQLSWLLMNLDPDDPAAQAAGISGFTIPSDYAPVEAAMMALRLPPFDQAPTFGWRDVWNRYTVELIFSSIAGLLIMALLATVYINNRKLALSRQAARQLRDRLQRIVDGTRAGTWEWNVQTGETVFNERWAEMIGYRLEELQPVSIETWMRFLHPEDASVSEAALERYFRGETDAYEVDVRMRHRLGHWIWVTDRGRVFSWTADGKPMWMFGTHIDISDRQKAILERDALLGRLTALAHNVPGILYQYHLRVDGTSHFPYSSPGIVNIYGCTPEDVKQDATIAFKAIHPEDVQRISESIQRSAREMTSWHEVFRINHPHLGLRWVEGMSTPIREENGGTTWHGYIRDITDLHFNEEKLRLAATVFDVSLEAIIITDADMRIVALNPSFTRITGYAQEEAIGRSPRELLTLDSDQTEYAEMMGKLKQTGHWHGELVSHRKSGELFPRLASIAAVTGKTGEIEHYVSIFTDITVIKDQQQQLNNLANYDVLTGLPNRRLLEYRLRKAMNEAELYRQDLAVCMMDLDGFKPINDVHGHDTGDQVLVEIGRRLQALTREEDTVARQGGDEFVLLFRNPEGVAVFERVLETVREPLQLAEGEMRVSASLGVAYLDHDHPCAGDQLLRQADQALYQSKQSGRNRYTIYQPAAPVSS